MLAGLVLAGGQSKRMGQDKSYLTLPNNRGTMLESSITTLEKLCTKVWVSGEQHQGGIVDIYPNCGPISGIHAALVHILSEYPQISELVIIPVDMPNLTTNEILSVIHKGRQTGLATYVEQAYFPFYLPVSLNTLDYFDTLFEEGEANGLKKGRNKKYSIKNFINQMQASQLPPEQSQSFININTINQWQQHCDLTKRKH